MKRAGHAGKRPVADVFIESFACRFQGVITRNPKHFATVRVVVP
jgi:predicted nucleic acid-binding protein